MALTDTSIRNAKPKDKPYKLYDERGLFLQVTPSGGKWWRFKYRLGDKEKLLSLGTYPDVSLLAARQKRDEAKKLLAEGIDPSLEKQRAKQQSAIDANMTFEKVANDWLDIKSRTLAPNTLKKMQGALKANIFNRVGKQSIKDLRYKDIQTCLFVMQERGALRIMHETRRMIKSIFDFAVNDGIIDINPITQRDDRLHEHKAQNMPHLQIMADAGKLLRNLVEYGGNYEVQACVFITLHIAQRPSELRNAQWCEFDFDNALWTLPLERSKTRKHMTKPHTVPLSKQVLQRLEVLKQYTGHSDYLFISSRTNKPLSEATIRQALRTTFTDYHIVPHGCRHFFSTQANESGLFRKEAIDAFLQHKDSNEISATYNKAQYSKERADIAQWWSDQLDIAQAGAKVIPINSAA
jgi:integrase